MLRTANVVPPVQRNRMIRTPFAGKNCPVPNTVTRFQARAIIKSMIAQAFILQTSRERSRRVSRNQIAKRTYLRRILSLLGGPDISHMESVVSAELFSRLGLLGNINTVIVAKNPKIIPCANHNRAECPRRCATIGQMIGCTNPIRASHAQGLPPVCMRTLSTMLSQSGES